VIISTRSWGVRGLSYVVVNVYDRVVPGAGHFEIVLASKGICTWTKWKGEVVVVSSPILDLETACVAGDAAIVFVVLSYVLG
jgi:hypothetical protein